MGIDKIASAATGGGGSPFGGLTEGFQALMTGDIGGIAKAASGFLPPPQNMIAGAAAGLLAGEGLDGAMGSLMPGSIGDALGSVPGLDEGIIGGITDAATNLQSDPSADNLGKLFESLTKIPEDKREAAFNALKEKFPPAMQERLEKMMGGQSGGSQTEQPTAIS